jgi:hypothetical protein
MLPLLNAARSTRHLIACRHAAARGLSASPPPPETPSVSLSYGLKHLHGDDKAAPNKSPIGSILATFVFFGLAAGLGWGLAQPKETAAQLSEAASTASAYARALVTGEAEEEAEEEE